MAWPTDSTIDAVAPGRLAVDGQVDSMPASVRCIRLRSAASARRQLGLDDVAARSRRGGSWRSAAPGSPCRWAGRASGSAQIDLQAGQVGHLRLIWPANVRAGGRPALALLVLLELPTSMRPTVSVRGATGRRWRSRRRSGRTSTGCLDADDRGPAFRPGATSPSCDSGDDCRAP